MLGADLDETITAVIARLDRATQYSRDGRVQPRRRGVRDRPVKPGDDRFVVAGVLPSPDMTRPNLTTSVHNEGFTIPSTDVFPACQIPGTGGPSVCRPNQGPSSNQGDGDGTRRQKSPRSTVHCTGGPIPKR